LQAAGAVAPSFCCARYRAARLPPCWPQELLVAGHCALWRAAAGYSPDARPGGCRFSTYAVAAIRNAMRDVLAGRGSRVVSPPSAAQGSAKQVSMCYVVQVAAMRIRCVRCSRR
jgi:DNA-directed RNA polymerase specialized sigma subunit